MTDTLPIQVPPRRSRRHPLRLLHLMALVAGAALTLIVTPAFMPVIRSPFMTASGKQLFIRQLADQTSIALAFWTPILMLIAVFGKRSQLGRVSRSYGISAVLAAAAALFLLFARSLSWTLLFFRAPGSVFPVVSVYSNGAYYCPTAEKLIDSAPDCAAAAIVAVWSILALTRAGRRPSNWFESVCLLFGLFWVLWYIGRDFLLHLPW